MQTSLLRNPHCPFKPFLDEGDTHCFEPRSPDRGYEVISEDHPDFDLWLADINNIGFGDIKIQPVNLPEFPDFIPSIGNGNGRLFKNRVPKFVATTLGDLLSPKLGRVRTDVHTVTNMPRSTVVLVLGYTNDTILEKLWAERYRVVPQLAKLNCIYTAPDYSVFANQPHAERLINMKRSLIIFEMLQQLGVQVIPHMHWFGFKDLERWAELINRCRAIEVLALDLQMLEPEYMWRSALAQLGYFVVLLNRQLHFIVSGPTTLARIQQVRDVLGLITITSGLPIQVAIRHRRLIIDLNEDTLRAPSALPLHRLTDLNIKLMQQLCSTRDRLSVYSAAT